MAPVTRILRDKGGATAVEYALIGALVFLAWLGAMQLVGNNTATMYNHVASAITSAMSS